MSTSLLLLLLLTLLAACPVAARVGDGWGTNIHWTSETQPGEAAMLAKAFRVARMDLTWAAVERKCGEYDFSQWDVLLKTMQIHGIRPYWILDYDNPCYPGTVPKSCDTPTCIAAYGRFAAAIAARYKGHGIIFESVNEPNGMGKDNATVIAALCKAAWPAFSAVGETFVGPATSGIPLEYLNSAFKDGILHTLSAVSVHPYRSSEPETALLNYGELHELLKLYKSQLRVYNGEWGYTTATPKSMYLNRVDLDTQGKYVPRMWLTSLLAGVDISIDYDWHDDGPDPAEGEHNFGSVYYAATGNASQPFKPKPSYYAALTIQQGVGNADRFDMRVDAHMDDDLIPIWDVFVLRFVTGNDDEYAYWQDSIFTTSSFKVKFSSSKKQQQCWLHVDTYGRSLGQLCSDAKGEVVVTATNGPQYLLHQK